MVISKCNSYHILILVTVLSLPLLAEESEKITLTYNFKEDHSWQAIHTFTDYTLISKSPSETYSERSKKILYLKHEIGAVEPNGCTWKKSTFESIKLEKTKHLHASPENQEKVVYDSEKDNWPENPSAQYLAAWVGESINNKHNQMGDIVGEKDSKNLRTKLIKKVPDGPFKNDVIAKLRTATNKKLNRKEIETDFFFHSDKPLKVGQDAKYEIPFYMYSAKIDYNITLEKRQNGVAFVKIEGDIRHDPDIKPIIIEPRLTKYNVSGTIYGKGRIEEKTGKTIEGSLSFQMSGTMFVEEPPGHKTSPTYFVTMNQQLEIDTIKNENSVANIGRNL